MPGHRIEWAVERLQWEYLSVPGLKLSVHDASALTGHEVPLCEAILEAMAHSRMLERTSDGAYVLRASERLANPPLEES